MILLHTVVQILALGDVDLSLFREVFVYILQASLVGTAFVDVDLLRFSIGADGFEEKLLGSLAIPAF